MKGEMLIGVTTVGRSKHLEVTLAAPLQEGFSPSVFIRLIQEGALGEPAHSAAWIAVRPDSVPAIIDLLTKALERVRSGDWPGKAAGGQT